MKIKELIISKNSGKKLDVSWKLSGGKQSSCELFLIQGGSVIEMVKSTGSAMKCTLQTIMEPMKEYILLLTVGCDQTLSSVRAGFVPDRDAVQYQRIMYIET